MCQKGGGEKEGGGIRMALCSKQAKQSLGNRSPGCSREDQTVCEDPTLTTEVLELISNEISNQDGEENA